MGIRYHVMHVLLPNLKSNCYVYIYIAKGIKYYTGFCFWV